LGGYGKVAHLTEALKNEVNNMGISPQAIGGINGVLGCHSRFNSVALSAFPVHLWNLVEAQDYGHLASFSMNPVRLGG
jgi:hypothetical protein